MSKENDDFDLTEVLRSISSTSRRIQETPLAQGVKELINEVNQEALEGEGAYNTTLGLVPTDTHFSLEWEGAITKKQQRMIYNFTVLVNPFNLSIHSYKTEDEFYGFKVTAKYVPGDVEAVEVGRTARLDIGELRPIVRGQIPNIRQAAQR